MQVERRQRLVWGERSVVLVRGREPAQATYVEWAAWAGEARADYLNEFRAEGEPEESAGGGRS